jgi:hypothetical protein
MDWHSHFAREEMDTHFWRGSLDEYEQGLEDEVREAGANGDILQQPAHNMGTL